MELVGFLAVESYRSRFKNYKGAYAWHVDIMMIF
jgi:hypothetical protein